MKIKLDGVTVTFVAVDTLLELVFINERHNLREDDFFLCSWLKDGFLVHSIKDINF